MEVSSSRLSVGFARVGHFHLPVVIALFLTLVLLLEPLRRLPYHSLIALWTLGALLLGLGAVAGIVARAAMLLPGAQPKTADAPFALAG